MALWRCASNLYVFYTMSGSPCDKTVQHRIIRMNCTSTLNFNATARDVPSTVVINRTSKPANVRPKQTSVVQLHICLLQAGSCVISGFRRDVNGICALLGCYAALIVSLLPTFRGYLSVPSSRVKQCNSSWAALPLKMGPIGCPETSVTN
jgi:hypothetical protein